MSAPSMFRRWINQVRPIPIRCGSIKMWRSICDAEAKENKHEA
jgi:hypothetical protein